MPVNAVRADEGVWQAPGMKTVDVPNSNSRMTPLIAASPGSHEDLALWLLTLPEQELDLNRRIDDNATILHICAQLGSTRVVRELMRRGADMDLCEKRHETPLCIAASYARLTLVRFFLQQYQRRGQSELERALSNPCRKEGTEKCSLLAHVVKKKSSLFNIPRAYGPPFGTRLGGGHQVVI